VSDRNLCLWCEEPVTPSGVQQSPIPSQGADGSWELRLQHRECAARAILGGLNHLQGRCSCCGGTEPPDPPALSRRQAALAAFAWIQEHTVPPIPLCDPRRVRNLTNNFR